MKELEEGGFGDLIISQLKALKEWLKPEPTDNVLLKVLKGIGKAIAVLILILFSPVILIILLFVFFAVL